MHDNIWLHVVEYALNFCLVEDVKFDDVWKANAV